MEKVIWDKNPKTEIRIHALLQVCCNYFIPVSQEQNASAKCMFYANVFNLGI